MGCGCNKKKIVKTTKQSNTNNSNKKSTLIKLPVKKIKK
jgi:hypothetical protein